MGMGVSAQNRTQKITIDANAPMLNTPCIWHIMTCIDKNHNISSDINYQL